jgi:hypothetical protein
MLKGKAVACNLMKIGFLFPTTTKTKRPSRKRKSQKSKNNKMMEECESTQRKGARVSRA